MVWYGMGMKELRRVGWCKYDLNRPRPASGAPSTDRRRAAPRHVTADSAKLISTPGLRDFALRRPPLAAITFTLV